MQNIFAGKNIVVAVTGSIAAFKVAGWVSSLAKDDAQVNVIMTESAQKFITPLTFAAVSGNRVHSTMFDNRDDGSMAHIDLGREADIVVIAPATANTIAQLAGGLANDLLGTTVLATKAPVIVCPAMNSRMYQHPATQKNIQLLRGLGYLVIDPDSGTMACKEEGQGRLPDWEPVKEYLARSLSLQDLAGQTVLVTAGPTREPIDPARYLSNRSSGKMGYALAQAAFRRGAKVILVSGPSSLDAPIGVETIKVTTATEMRDTVLSISDQCSVIIKAAAVADYRPTEFHDNKVKKENISSDLTLSKNPDILLELGQQKREGQILVGFAAESQDLQKEGKKKLEKKNLDFIAVNDISTNNTGFEVDTNQITLMSKTGEFVLPHTTKIHTANLILDNIVPVLSTAL